MSCWLPFSVWYFPQVTWFPAFESIGLFGGQGFGRFWYVFKRTGISNHVVYIILGNSCSLTLQGLKILRYTSLCNTRKIPHEQKCLLFHSPCIWCFIPSGTSCLPKDCLTTVWQFPNGKKCWVSSKGREELFKVLYLIFVKSKQLYPFNISHACCIKYSVKHSAKERKVFPYFVIINIRIRDWIRSNNPAGCGARGKLCMAAGWLGELGGGRRSSTAPCWSQVAGAAFSPHAAPTHAHHAWAERSPLAGVLRGLKGVFKRSRMDRGRWGNSPCHTTQTLPS